MKLLLDTHVLLWWLDGEPLARRAREAVSQASNVDCVSAASAWEIGVKSALGKLRLPDDLGARVRSERFTQRPVAVAHGLAVASLRLFTATRSTVLVARARLEGFGARDTRRAPR